MLGVQCSGGEGDGSGSHHTDFLDRGRWEITIGFRKQRSHRHFVGTDEQEERAERGTEVVNNIYLSDVALTYGVSRRFNLTVAVPIQFASRRSGSSPQIFHSNGIGDVTLLARWWLVKPPAEKRDPGDKPGEKQK